MNIKYLCERKNSSVSESLKYMSLSIITYDCPGTYYEFGNFSPNPYLLLSFRIPQAFLLETY